MAAGGEGLPLHGRLATRRPILSTGVALQARTARWHAPTTAPSCSKAYIRPSATSAAACRMRRPSETRPHASRPGSGRSRAGLPRVGQSRPIWWSCSAKRASRFARQVRRRVYPQHFGRTLHRTRSLASTGLLYRLLDLGRLEQQPRASAGPDQGRHARARHLRPCVGAPRVGKRPPPPSIGRARTAYAPPATGGQALLARP